jgi:hypothetical protein
MGDIRNRIRPAGTLQARLLAMARVARRKAKELPEGPERLQLLQRPINRSARRRSSGGSARPISSRRGSDFQNVSCPCFRGLSQVMSCC